MIHIHKFIIQRLESDGAIENYSIFRWVMLNFRVSSYALLPRLPWSLLVMLGNEIFNFQISINNE